MTIGTLLVDHIDHIGIFALVTKFADLLARNIEVSNRLLTLLAQFLLIFDIDHILTRCLCAPFTIERFGCSLNVEARVFGLAFHTHRRSHVNHTRLVLTASGTVLWQKPRIIECRLTFVALDAFLGEDVFHSRFLVFVAILGNFLLTKVVAGLGRLHSFESETLDALFGHDIDHSIFGTVLAVDALLFVWEIEISHTLVTLLTQLVLVFDIYHAGFGMLLAEFPFDFCRKVVSCRGAFVSSAARLFASLEIIHFAVGRLP